MADERISQAREFFGVDFADYDRPGATGILITSGCGIGMGIMDVFPEVRWFCDVDQYRHQPVDWEALSIFLTAGDWRPGFVILAGWFSLDRAVVFDRFQAGACRTPVFRYDGGGGTSLADFLAVVRDAVTPQK
jgi:hypothetical protein